MTKEDLINKGWFLEDLLFCPNRDEWCHDKIEPYSISIEEAIELEKRTNLGENFDQVFFEILNKDNFFNQIYKNKLN